MDLTPTIDWRTADHLLDQLATCGDKAVEDEAKAEQEQRRERTTRRATHGQRLLC